MATTQDGGDKENHDSDGISPIMEKFRQDGYIVLKQVIPSDLVEAFRVHAENVFRDVFGTLHRQGHTPFPVHFHDDTYTLELGVKNGFREVVMRSPGRYELSLLLNQDEQHQNVLRKGLYQRLLDALVSVGPQLMGETSWDNVHVCNLSLVVSTPGTAEQSWHADGGHVNVKEHEPSHVANIFIPLSNITMEMGPTQVRPGSHFYTRNLAPLLLAAKARNALRPPTAPLLTRGDTLAFDYRILHRGLANTTADTTRTILVLTVAKKWFRDRLNFPSRSIYDPAEAQLEPSSKPFPNSGASSAD